MPKLHATLKSGNRKIGPMPATYRTQDSCPQTCPFLKKGCYAEGRIFAIPERFGKTEAAVLAHLANKVAEKAVIRHHVSGDLNKEDGEVDGQYLELLKKMVEKRPDLLHIMYTHTWKSFEKNPLPFVVNASCETPEEVEEATRRGFEAVITLKGPDDPLLGKTIAGKKVVQCPAEYREGFTCQRCKLCARKRRSVVAFVPHGAGAKLASRSVQRKRSETHGTDTTEGSGPAKGVRHSSQVTCAQSTTTTTFGG